MIEQAFEQMKKEVLKPSQLENEYIPKNGINNANRKQFFDNVDVELLERIKEVKLNQNK